MYRLLYMWRVPNNMDSTRSYNAYESALLLCTLSACNTLTILAYIQYADIYLINIYSWTAFTHSCVSRQLLLRSACVVVSRQKMAKSVQISLGINPAGPRTRLPTNQTKNARVKTLVWYKRLFVSSLSIDAAVGNNLTRNCRFLLQVSLSNISIEEWSCHWSIRNAVVKLLC